MEGQKDKGRCTWAVEFALAHIPKTVFQVFDDECCITKGTFHAKMGLIKDRKDMDLTEAEVINKRWQEFTDAQYKKSS